MNPYLSTVYFHLCSLHRYLRCHLPKQKRKNLVWTAICYQQIQSIVYGEFHNLFTAKFDKSPFEKSLSWTNPPLKNRFLDDPLAKMPSSSMLLDGRYWRTVNWTRKQRRIWEYLYRRIDGSLVKKFCCLLNVFCMQKRDKKDGISSLSNELLIQQWALNLI